jgi:cyclopropane fatty-acyl-phospholipid synthase-like methyltransferase
MHSSDSSNNPNHANPSVLAVDRRGSMRADLARIRAYYDETWLDYRMLWLNPANRAIHFGYWDATTRTHAESLIKMNQVMAARLNLCPRLHVLDAGCGVGGTAMWLAEQFQVRVTGITPVASQVARAQSYARARGLENLVRFAEQDYLHTDFPDGTFDIIWAQESVCHAPDKHEFLEAAHRLLKPGGQLIIAEYLRLGRPYTERNEALLHSWLDGWAIPDLASGTEFIEWARAVGFRDTQLADITPQVRPSLRRLYTLAILFWPLHSALKTLRMRSDVQAGNVRGARDQWRALQRGLWFYGIFTAGKP